jgi:RNA polymerase sigma factor (sigma-70 family)
MSLSVVPSDMASAADDGDTFEDVLLRERRRLVALCAGITRNQHVAEDLAQETLIEAWRHLHTLRRKVQFSAWLNGIARNVCRRWARARGHELASRFEPLGY